MQLKALKDAKFGGKVVKKDADEQPKAQAPAGPQVAFHVTGMQKTKSGAT